MLLVQQTAFAEQALPEPTPTTVIGEQPRPMRPVMSPRTMPSRPNRMFDDSELACKRSAE